MAFKPNDTQELLARNAQIQARASGDTDRHRLNDLMWEAMKNNDDATRNMDVRLVRLESTLATLKWLIGAGVPVILALLAALHLKMQP